MDRAGFVRPGPGNGYAMGAGPIRRHAFLDGTSSAPRAARHLVLDALIDLPQRSIEVAQLLVSELVSIAVRHGAPRVVVSAEHTGNVVRVEVVEQTAVVDAAPAPGISAEDDELGDRFLQALAERHGHEMHSDGMASWFELEVFDPRRAALQAIHPERARHPRRRRRH